MFKLQFESCTIVICYLQLTYIVIESWETTHGNLVTDWHYWLISLPNVSKWIIYKYCYLVLICVPFVYWSHYKNLLFDWLLVNFALNYLPLSIHFCHQICHVNILASTKLVNHLWSFVSSPILYGDDLCWLPATVCYNWALFTLKRVIIFMFHRHRWCNKSGTLNWSLPSFIAWIEFYAYGPCLSFYTPDTRIRTRPSTYWTPHTVCIVFLLYVMQAKLVVLCNFDTKNCCLL
jgi:hypothetical protein